MTKAKHFHSINFILWLSFLLFAALIITLTWVFQTTLLRVLLGKETQDELESVGAVAYIRLKDEIPVTGNEEDIARFVGQVQGENIAVSVYIVKGDGTLLFPSEQADNYTADKSPVDFDAALAALDIARQHGEDISAGKCVGIGEEEFAYIAQLGADAMYPGDGAGTYLYIDYSTEPALRAMGTMRVQLILISVIVIFLALVVSALLSMKLTKPITRLTAAAKRMAAGDFTVNFTGEYSYAEMDTLAETLDYAKEEIGKSDALQKEVLANVTHDLKTPLTMIKAYASMIQEISGDNPEKRTKHTQVIIDESDRLTSLVNDILNLSKIRSGMDTLKLTTFNLSEFVHTVLERFDYLTETKGYTITRDIEDELYIEADMEKIEQVVYNLVGNAVNYTGDDKVIRVGLHREGKAILFTVGDTGKGIPPEELETIWDRYYSSAETHKRPIKGTGLGLSIVKTILLKHGFDFGVESEVGKGSTFYVLFPEK